MKNALMGAKAPPSSAPLTDAGFAMRMITHHQMAITMARNLLKTSRDPGLRNLAQEIMWAQQPEIEYLQRWLAKKK